LYSELGTIDLMGLDKDPHLDFLHEGDLHVVLGIFQNLGFLIEREGIGSMGRSGVDNILDTVLGHENNKSIRLDASDIGLFFHHLVLKEEHSKQGIRIHRGMLSHPMFLVQHITNSANTLHTETAHSEKEICWLL